MTLSTKLVAGSINQVNETTTGDEGAVGMARLANGNYVLTWFVKDTGSGDFGLYGREYHADGTPAYETGYGDNFLVTQDASPDTTPAITAWGSGFVVYWANADETGWQRQYFNNLGGSEPVSGVNDGEFQAGFGTTTLTDGTHVFFSSNRDDTIQYRLGGETGTPDHQFPGDVLTSADFLTEFHTEDFAGRVITRITPVALSGGGYVALMSVYDNDSGHVYQAIEVFGADGSVQGNFTSVAASASQDIQYATATALDDGRTVAIPAFSPSISRRTRPATATSRPWRRTLSRSSMSPRPRSVTAAMSSPGCRPLTATTSTTTFSPSATMRPARLSATQ
ncbi:MAG: hypothetical protein WDN06_15310 [Asticcacaulis sp.]